MDQEQLTARGVEIENVMGSDFIGPAEAAVYCLSTGDNVTLGFRGNPDEALKSAANILGFIFYKTNTTDLEPFIEYFYEEVTKAMIRFATGELEAEKEE